MDATRHIAIDVAEGRLKPEEINDSLFSHRLYTYHVPDPDLLIRTAGGEMRISNFCYGKLPTVKSWLPMFCGLIFARMICWLLLQNIKSGTVVLAV